MKAGDDRVLFDNAKPLPVSQKREGADAERGYDTVCFFGDALPSNLVRGRRVSEKWRGRKMNSSSTEEREESICFSANSSACLSASEKSRVMAAGRQTQVMLAAEPGINQTKVRK